MKEKISWFETFYQSNAYSLLKQRPIAYFCAEFAFSDSLPIFAGGLGVLAADYVREAAERDIPLVAVGIYYKEGYVCRKINENGQIIESINTISPEQSNLTPVTTPDGKRLILEIQLYDRMVKIQSWKLQFGKITVYLLDTNVKDNTEDDQKITNRLYVSDIETRLKQQVILGIGGLKLIEKQQIHPLLYHMNEGNSAFLALELIRHEIEERKIDFFSAIRFAQKRIVFTNHTLVSAGNDLYNDDLIISVLNNFVQEKLKVPIQQVLKLGKVNENTMFSMTTFSLSMAGRVNAVSKLHAKRAQNIWENKTMHEVTNGINIKFWNKILDETQIYKAHQENKKKLLEAIKNASGETWRENELLLGWARRMVLYKRPLAVIEDTKRFLSLAKREGQTVKIVFAGEAHPNDSSGLELIKTLRAKISNELAGVAVYLPNYNLNLAHLLTSGCDVWLNTPIVGFEACGTSGMKAALNGVLPVSTKDGWIDEVNLYEIGWTLDDKNITESFMDILEKNIIPLYYGNHGNQISKYWELNMINARNLILNNFSTTKMLQEYVHSLYIPLIDERYNA